MKLVMLFATIALLNASVAFAKGKLVDCSITSLPGNDVQFKGRCRVIP